MNLATLAGAEVILLLGYDMQATDGKTHWHGDHPPGLNNPKEGNYARWRQNFATMIPDLAELSVEVVNCSRKTALKGFPMARLEDVL